MLNNTHIRSKPCGLAATLRSPRKAAYDYYFTDRTWDDAGQPEVLDHAWRQRGVLVVLLWHLVLVSSSMYT